MSRNICCCMLFSMFVMICLHNLIEMMKPEHVHVFCETGEIRNSTANKCGVSRINATMSHKVSPPSWTSDKSQNACFLKLKTSSPPSQHIQSLPKPVCLCQIHFEPSMKRCEKHCKSYEYPLKTFKKKDGVSLWESEYPFIWISLLLVPLFFLHILSQSQRDGLHADAGHHGRDFNVHIGLVVHIQDQL